MTIIDLSKYNTVTNWQKVKTQVDGIILRCGYRGYGSGKIVLDNKFKEYAVACKQNNIPFGLYFMSQAINEKEGAEEAAFTVKLAKEYGATLPLYIDSEDGDGTAKVVRADGLSKVLRTKIVKAFCNKVNELGYIGGVYASESWFNSKLNYSELVMYNVWVAKYGKNTGVKSSTVKLNKCDMHQYTSKGKVDGIKGNVDINEAYNLGKTEKTEEVYNMPVIQNGSTGKAVKIWQIIVGTEPDGIFGDKTEAATRGYQEENGLTVDGIVGKNSWKAGLESV